MSDAALFAKLGLEAVQAARADRSGSSPHGQLAPTGDAALASEQERWRARDMWRELPEALPKPLLRR